MASPPFGSAGPQRRSRTWRRWLSRRVATEQGFDRFYGFLGGETNQWYPDLVKDNDFIDQPYMPEDGYHLSKDLADQAIEMLRNKNASNPSKPFFVVQPRRQPCAAPGSPEEWIAKYKGKFDDGYDAYRVWAAKRMKEKGVILKTLLTLPSILSRRTWQIRSTTCVPGTP